MNCWDLRSGDRVMVKVAHRKPRTGFVIGFSRKPMINGQHHVRVKIDTQERVELVHPQFVQVNEK